MSEPNSNKKSGLFTDGSSPRVNSIPLTDADAHTVGNNSIGALVGDATDQLSRLFRSEVELAKAEIAGEAKKGVIGGGLFGAAGTIALYSTFFLFFALAELLSLWIPHWVSFLIVFILMLVLAAGLALFGYRKVRKIGVPTKTIESVGELKKLVPGQAQKSLEAPNQGLYS